MTRPAGIGRLVFSPLGFLLGGLCFLPDLSGQESFYKGKTIRVIIQTGRQKDPRLPDTATMYELMDRYKTPDASRRLATIILASGALGRPMLGTPGIPPERVKILRDAFNATMKDPAFLDEIKKRKFELEPARGEELEAIVKACLSRRRSSRK